MKKLLFSVTGFLGLFALTYRVQQAAYDAHCPDWCTLPVNIMHPWIPWASINDVAAYTLVILSLQTIAVGILLFYVPIRWGVERFEDGIRPIMVCMATCAVLYAGSFTLWNLGQGGTRFDWHTILFWFSMEEGQLALRFMMGASLFIGLLIFTCLVIVTFASVYGEHSGYGKR